MCEEQTRSGYRRVFLFSSVVTLSDSSPSLWFQHYWFLLSPDGVNLNLSSIFWLFSPSFIFFGLFLTSSFHVIPFFFAFPSLSMRTTCLSGLLMFGLGLTHQIPNMHPGFQEVYPLFSFRILFLFLFVCSFCLLTAKDNTSHVCSICRLRCVQQQTSAGQKTNRYFTSLISQNIWPYSWSLWKVPFFRSLLTFTSSWFTCWNNIKIWDAFTCVTRDPSAKCVCNRGGVELLKQWPPSRYLISPSSLMRGLSLPANTRKQ